MSGYGKPPPPRRPPPRPPDESPQVQVIPPPKPERKHRSGFRGQQKSYQVSGDADGRKLAGVSERPQSDPVLDLTSVAPDSLSVKDQKLMKKSAARAAHSREYNIIAKALEVVFILMLIALIIFIIGFNASRQ